MNKSEIIRIVIISCVIVLLPFVGNSDVLINIKGSNVEITGAGGKSNVGTVEGCVKGNGKEKSEKRLLSSFSAIDIDGAFDVNVNLQEKNDLELKSDENILPHIITEVRNGTLRISSRQSICPVNPMVINVSTENIDRITADGSNDIDVSKVKNSEFEVRLNGASDFRASGETGRLSVKVTGASTVLAKSLQAQEVEVALDGSGDAVVNASRKLVAEINGAGDIRYFGNPPDVTKRIHGVGDIVAE